MRNKGTWILFLVVVLISTYAYFGEYKGKEKEKLNQEAQSKIFKDVKMEQVNQIVLEKTAEKIKLQRGTDGWTLSEPIKDSADSEGVESWLKLLADEKTMTVAVEGSDIQWKFFGFDQNITKLTLSTSAGNSTSVEISEKKNFENNCFLRFPGQNKVYVVSSSWTGYATKKVFDLRNKKLFRHQMSNVQSILIKNKKGSFIFENKEAKWISPTKSDWVFDQNKVRESIAKLNEAQATEVQFEGEALVKEKSKFKSADVSFEIKLTDKTWSAALVQNKDKSYSMLVSDPNMIVKVDSSFGDKFSAVMLDEYRDTKLPFMAVDKAKVKAIDLETSLKKSSLVQKNGGWDLAVEDKTMEVQQEKVGLLLEKLKDLNVLQYASQNELKKAKLSQKINLLDQDKKSVFQLSMTETIKKKIDNLEKNVRLAKTSLYPEPFVIDESEIEKLQLNELTKIKVSKENQKAVDMAIPGIDPKNLPSNKDAK